MKKKVGKKWKKNGRQNKNLTVTKKKKKNASCGP